MALKTTVAVACAVLVLAACTAPGGSSSGQSKCDAAKATSATACGGINGLIQAARAEGHLNVIALPADWANFGAIINGFSAKYGISVTSELPGGSSIDEIRAVKQGGHSGNAPDVVDLNMGYIASNTNLFAPYKVQTWNDIAPTQKDPTGLWLQDYGGVMAIAYDSTKVPTVYSVDDLLTAPFKGKISFRGDPARLDVALSPAMMANLAEGGTTDDITGGVDFFHQLKLAGSLSPLHATSKTITGGTTPVVLDWDYMSERATSQLPGWKLFVPSGAIVGNYFAQAINKNAPHAAAARLWEEYLYSDEAQNLFLKGLVRPVRMDAMQQAGTLDKRAAAVMPYMDGDPQFLTDDQLTAADQYLKLHWLAAIS